MTDIIIDARMIPYTGVGRYTAAISKRLPELDPKRRYNFILPSPRYKEMLDPKEEMNNARWIFDSTPRYTIREHLNITRYLLNYKPALFHSMSYIMPPLTPCPSIVTMYDIIRQMMPESFYTNGEFIRRFGISRFLQLSITGLALLPFNPRTHMKVGKYLSPDYRSWISDQSTAAVSLKMQHLYQTSIMSIVTKNVDKIITLSAYSKKDICQLFSVPESKVEIVYGAVDDIFHPVYDSIQLALIRRAYNLPQRFIMYVGLWRFHKNLHGLIRAFSDLVSYHEFQDVHLAIVGEEDRFETHIQKLIQELALKDRVIFTGYVPDEDLVLLYNLATVVVLPSFYEGFGLPVLEAMACGTPIVASSTTALPEVVGSAGILVDPFSKDALPQAIASILSNTDLRKRLSAAGLERSKDFSWDRATRETLRVYESVLGAQHLIRHSVDHANDL